MLELDDYFRIEPDNLNFTLKFEKPFINKNGVKNVSRNEWFCSNLKHALKVYAKECIRLELMNNTSLDELIKRFDQLEEKIDNLSS